jgi:DNA-binding response OmpR family regulator
MKKILIIEDDELISKTYQTIFEANGYEVDFAFDIKKGWEKIVEMQPDVILLDLMLQGVSGVEVLEKIRNQKNTKMPIVIVITNLQGEKICQEVLDHGASLCLIKDQYTPKQIYDQVTAVLK